MNKKGLYLGFNILLWAAGFPVLFIISLVYSIKWDSYGMYGASAWAPLIAVIILAALVLGIQALVYNLYKKKGNLKGMAFKLAIIPIAVIIGLMGIIDIAMPSLLKDATSGTILYEDVVDDYQGVHEQLEDRFNKFKEINGLGENVKFSDKAFQNVFNPIFESMDQAYNAFDKLAIEMALDGSTDDLVNKLLDGRFPLDVAITLMLATAPGNGNNHNQNIFTTIKDNMDLIGNGLMSVILDLVGGNEADLNELLDTILVEKTYDGISWNILQILGTNPLDASANPNAAIYRESVDEFGFTTQEYMGACLGYQDMAWLNGLPMMFFIPLMQLRPILYLFAALLAIFAVAQYYAAEIYAKKNDKEVSILMMAK